MGGFDDFLFLFGGRRFAGLFLLRLLLLFFPAVEPDHADDDAQGDTGKRQGDHASGQRRTEKDAQGFPEGEAGVHQRHEILVDIVQVPGQ